jgi:uncharacterized protein YndB with AHSA1/START domain
MIENNVSKSTIAPVEKRAHVKLSVGEAFKLFTEGIHTWWPLDADHSVGEENAETCAIEPKVGGRVYEILKDGSESIWGTVQAYEPPHLFATTWHPGNPSDLATYLEVRFTASGEGTIVELTHSGWEARGADAQNYRDGYDSGCDFVFGRYLNKATS